jgi:hypothetical protein
MRKKRSYLDMRGVHPQYDIPGQGSTVTFLKIPEI